MDFIVWFPSQSITEAVSWLFPFTLSLNFTPPLLFYTLKNASQFLMGTENQANNQNHCYG